MTLFKYIIKDFFKYVIGAVVLCMFLFVLFDFIHKTTKYFGTYKPATKYLIQYYLFQVPNLALQAIPIGSLLASVICMVLLSRTNEVTAMRAAGMGPLRIGAPVAIGGLFLSLLSLTIGETIAPLSAKKMRYVESVLIEGENADEVSGEHHWLRHGNQLFHFREYDPTSKKLLNVQVIETGLNFRPKQTIEAKFAVYQPDTDQWLLSGIKVLYFNPNGTLAYTEHRDQQLEAIPIEPKKLQKERRKPNELSIYELYDSIQKGRESGLDVASLSIDMQFKFALHFAAFVVCLMGLKFGYKSERTVETAKGVLVAIGVGLSYWVILNAATALGKRGVLPPIMAAWMANFVIFGIGCVEIYRTRKAA